MKKFFICFISMLFIFLLFNIYAQAAKNNNENKTPSSTTDKPKPELPYLPKIKPLKSKIFKKTSLEIAALKKAAISYYEETGAWPLDAERLKAFGLKKWNGKSSWGTPISFYVKNGEFIISNKVPDNLHAAFEGFGRIEKDKKTGKVNIHIAPPNSIQIRDNAKLFEQDIIISKSEPILRLEDTNISDLNLTDSNISDSNLSDANNSLSVFIMNKNGELVFLDNKKLPNIRVKQKGDVEIKGNLSAVSNSIRLKNIENEGSSLIEMADAANKYKAVLRVGDKYKNDKEEVIPEGFQMGTISKHPVTMLVNNSPRVIIDEENLSSPNINAINIHSGNIAADNIKINKTINGEDITKLLDGLIVLINSKELSDIVNRNVKLMTETNIEDYAISIAGTKALVGDIIPAISSKYIIGSSARSFKAGYFDSLYISGSSLYMDGVKVLSSEGAILNGDISGTGVKAVIDENNPSDVKLASEKAITDYVQEKVANISGIPGKLQLGGDFITTGDMTLNVMGGGTTEITLPVTGTLATREWTLAQNLSANIALSDLTNVADNLPDTAGNMLIWDNSGILQSKALTRDVSVNQYGVATVNSIDGEPITLGGAFETVNPIKLEASKDVTVKIEDSGTLATQAYVVSQIVGSNMSAATTLASLTDTDITASDSSGDIIIWDAGSNTWINKKISQDVSLEKTGAATVTSIGGKSISLEAPFKTTGDKIIELKASAQNVMLTIEDTGIVATKGYVTEQMKDVMPNEISSPVTGNLVIWDGDKNKWVNNSLYQDVSLEKDGKATVTHIGGKTISLGAGFKTNGAGGNIELNASAPVSVEIHRSGVLATIDDINDYIIAAGEAARLEDLTDVAITTSGVSGDIIIWDAISNKWVNKKVYQDVELAKDGKATVTHIGGKSISLGAGFKTNWGGNIELNASAPVSVVITDSGTLATKEYVDKEIFAASGSAKLKDLSDTVISDTISAGDLLIWDGSSEWVSRSISGDINLDAGGAAIISKIGDKPISLEAEFKTTGGGNIELKTPNTSPVSVEIRDSGILSTRTYVDKQILAANRAATLANLLDANISSPIGGNILIWDSVRQQWANRKMMGDASLEANGAIEVAKIKGKSITLGGTFETSDAIKLNAPNSVIIDIPKSGTLATIADVDRYIEAANSSATLGNLIDTNISDAIASGDMLLWNDMEEQWYNKSITGDASIDKDGNTTVTSLKSGTIEFNSANPVNIEIVKSGEMATLADIDISLEAANRSATLENLIDTNISGSIASGDMLLWNNIEKQWYNRQIIGDASIDKDGNITVNSLRAGMVEFNASSPISIEITKSGRLARMEDLDAYIIAANATATLSNLVDTDINLAAAGNIVIWDDSAEKWINKGLSQDVTIDKGGVATVHSINNKPVSLGAGFSTDGEGTIEFKASSPVSIEIKNSGVLATQDYIAGQIEAANKAAELRHLVDTNISNTPVNADILVWDNNQWFNRSISGDIVLNKTGEVTISKVGGESISLGGGFQTTGDGTIILGGPVESSESVNVIIEDSGVLATKDYVSEMMIAANNSATLENLTDTEISDTIASRDILMWDGAKWVSRSVSGDIQLAADGGSEVKRIGGMNVDLSGHFATTGAGTITLNNPATKDISVNINKTGTVAMVDDLNNYIGNAIGEAQLNKLTDTNISDAIPLESGNILVWEDNDQKWFNRKVSGDVSLAASGEIIINKVAGKSISLGADFKTPGAGQIELNASSPVSIKIAESGIMATQNYVNARINDSGTLKTLIDTEISDTIVSRDILMWDGTKWVDRSISGDIQLTQEGKATVRTLDGVFINLGAAFETRGPGAINITAPLNVAVTMDESGILATKNYIAEQIDEVNNSGTLSNLNDIQLASEGVMINGSLLIWDNVQKKWFDREIGLDASLTEDGRLTVKSIGGKSISLGGELNTSGGKFITNGGDITFNAEGPTILTLPTTGTLATKEYVDDKDHALASLSNVIIDSVNDGSILVWDVDGGADGTGVWKSKSLSGDGSVDAEGKLTITHIGGQPINLGGEFRTAGKFITYGGDIRLRATSGYADLILPQSGTLATLDNITDMIRASNLTDLNDVDLDYDTLEGGQILVWDAAVAKWRNKGLTGDISLNNSDGNATVKSIGGHPVTLGGNFTTDGNLTFNVAGGEATLTLPVEGVLATLKGNETFFNKIIKDSNASFNKLSLDFEDNKYGDKSFDENETERWVMTLKDQNGTAEWRRATDIGAVWVAGKDSQYEELAYYDDNKTDNRSLGIGFSFNLINEDESPYPVRDNQSFDISETGDEDTILDYQLYVGRKEPLGGSIYAYGHIMAKDYYEFSDERLKENIASISSYAPIMDKIRNIEGVYYDWNSLYYDKNKINKKQRRQIGFIAQQLEKEFPELVQTETDGFKSVTYSKFVPVLLEGIKELDRQINHRENSIFIDPDGNINLKGIVKIDNIAIIDKKGNIAANNLKVKEDIQTSNTFSILRSDTLSALIAVSTEKRANKKVEGYISAKDIYIADKDRWASEFDSRIKIVSETPEDTSCSAENVGEMRFVSKDSTLCICDEKGSWLKFNTSEKEKKLAASTPIDIDAFFD